MSGTSDWAQILSIVLSVTASIIPAIWFLSTKIQGLAGELRATAVRAEEQTANLKEMIVMQQSLLKEAMAEQDNFRERLAIAEVHILEVRSKIS